ncbi:MAG: hypothetical protein KF711_11260 [Nitrospira sp.]|nr:hypothetical protein [Nitrospira sp.]
MNQYVRVTSRLAILCLLLGTPMIPGVPSKSEAVPLPGFTGNFELAGFGIVNYAVLSPFDSFSGVLAGGYVPAQGNSGFDASKYTYLYQVASMSPSPTNHVITSFQSEFKNSQAVSTTTVGAFTSGNLRLDFLNAGSIVNATGNNLQGPESLGIAARVVSGPEQIGVLTNPAFSGSQTHPYWSFQNLLGSGLTGPLVGYQSNLGPTMTIGFLDAFADFGSSTPGVYTGGFVSVPNAISTTAPEPNAALVIGSGMLGLLALHRRRWFTECFRLRNRK